MNRIKEINNNLCNVNYIYASDSKHFYKQGSLIKVLIDQDKLDMLKQYGWYVSPKGYIYTMIQNHTVFIHRLLLNNEDSLESCDVIDHTDNKTNLYKAWYTQNLYNTNTPVDMFTIEGVYCKTFNSQSEAALWISQNTKYTKASNGCISNVCNGRSQTAYGYIWKYKKGKDI